MEKILYIYQFHQSNRPLCTLTMFFLFKLCCIIKFKCMYVKSSILPTFLLHSFTVFYFYYFSIIQKPVCNGFKNCIYNRFLDRTKYTKILLKKITYKILFFQINIRIQCCHICCFVNKPTHR